MSLRDRQPNTPLYRILWWYLYRNLCWLFFKPLYRFRSFHADRIPERGPVLFVSNHQSFLDPIIVGMDAHRRQFYALARASLWKSRIYRWMTVPLNPIPVEQGTGDVKAMKRCIEVLKADHALLVFPEGARTPDGEVKDFEAGLMLIIKRAKPLVIPVALDGSYDVWPIQAKRPKLRGGLGCIYGEPIPAEQLLAAPANEALGQLQQSVVALHQELRQNLGKSAS